MGKIGGLHGGFSEYAVVESVTASKIPENVTFEQGKISKSFKKSYFSQPLLYLVQVGPLISHCIESLE